MNLRKIENPALVRKLDSVMSDGIDIFLLSRGRFRAAILHGTRLVNQMRANHELGVLETLILGHAYIGAALMATSLKGSDRIGIHIS
ncbi:Hsp33 family molecular chaperone HslO, partial [Salinispira pacifica]